MVFVIYGEREEREGIREKCERLLREREDEKLEEARAKFCTKIATAINEAKSYKLGANRDSEEIRRER